MVGARSLYLLRVSGVDDECSRELVVPALMARVERDPDHAEETERKREPEAHPANKSGYQAKLRHVLFPDNLESQQAHTEGPAPTEIGPEDYEVDQGTQDRAACACGHLLARVDRRAVVGADDQIRKCAGHETEEDG